MWHALPRVSSLMEARPLADRRGTPVVVGRMHVRRGEELALEPTGGPARGGHEEDMIECEEEDQIGSQFGLQS